MRVTVLHPEFGYGGSERLMLDIAAALASRGDDVAIVTHRVTRKISLDELGGADVFEAARRFPRHAAGRLRAPLTVAGLAALSVAERRRLRASDVVIVDLAPHVVPFVRRITPAPIVFYCHHPDAVLAPARTGVAYALYRAAIDRLEQRGFRAATRVLVNSEYTRTVLSSFVPLDPEPAVVRPAVEVAAFAGVAPLARQEPGAFNVLTLARFDPAKNLPLAVETVARLRTRLDATHFVRVHLTIAGGLTPWRQEHRETIEQLRQLAATLGVADAVQIVVNPSDAERLALLQSATCLLHPTTGEHFGLSVLEAMAAGRPVVAVDEGGVRESVVDRVTGWLCPPEAGAFADLLAHLANSPEVAARAGATAREHVERHHARGRFVQEIRAAVDGVAGVATRSNQLTG